MDTTHSSSSLFSRWGNSNTQRSSTLPKSHNEEVKEVEPHPSWYGPRACILCPSATLHSPLTLCSWGIVKRGGAFSFIVSVNNSGIETNFWSFSNSIFSNKFFFSNTNYGMNHLKVNFPSKRHLWDPYKHKPSELL